MAEQEKEFIKTNTIKDYLKTTHAMRSSEDAVQEIITRFSNVIEKVLTESVEAAKKEDRKTISLTDVQTPIEKAIGKKYLSWEDILKSILQQTPTNLANISKGISNYIKQEEKNAILPDQKELINRISREFKLPKLNSEKIVTFILSDIAK